MNRDVTYNSDINEIKSKRESRVEYLREFERCRNDKVYFLEKYIKVLDMSKGEVPFQLNRAQHKIHNKIENNRMNVCVSSRRVGGTTLLAGLCLHDLLFKDDYKTLYIGPKAPICRDFIRVVRQMLSYVKETFQCETQCSLDSVRVGNNLLLTSTIRSEMIRGTRFSNIVMDDVYASSRRNFEEAWEYIIPHFHYNSCSFFFIHTNTELFFDIYRKLLTSTNINKFNITIDDQEIFDDLDNRAKEEELIGCSWDIQYDYPWRFK